MTQPAEQVQLAQQAKEIFQSMGTAALENFIRHARDAPYTTPLWTSDDDYVFLPDENVIRHCRHRCYLPKPHFHFKWRDPDGAMTEETLPAMQPMVADNKLSEEMASITLLDWPNTESIHLAMLSIACMEACVDGASIADTPLGLAIMDTIAPDSRSAVNEEMRSDPQPSVITGYLEGLQRDYAADAVRRVPKPQWDALLNYLRQNLPS